MGEREGLSAPEVSEWSVVTAFMDAFQIAARLPRPCQRQSKMFQRCAVLESLFSALSHPFEARSALPVFNPF